MENNLTTGSVGKNLLFFSLPHLLSYFLQTLYGMADLYIIGQFDGVEAITAVSIGSQVMHMITVMLVGLAMGATVTIAQRSWSWADNICGATSGTASLQAFISASACISVPAADRKFPFCTMCARLSCCGSPALTWHPSGFRIRCFRWDWQPRRPHCCQWRSV